MVYISNSFKICHNLTKIGQIEYHKMLEKEADKILFKKNHPFKYFIQYFKEIIQH